MIQKVSKNKLVQLLNLRQQETLLVQSYFLQVKVAWMLQELFRKVDVDLS
jgi:predicted nuclease of restriction endonuclease-like RecB superfamily